MRTAGGRRGRLLTHVLMLGVGMLVTASIARQSGAAEYQEKVLYSFCTKGLWDGCADGELPSSGVIADNAGDLFGTTELGGANGPDCSDWECGAVFELVPNLVTQKTAEKVIYSFCTKECTDGSWPVAGLTRDGSGNLYGTSDYGGRVNCAGFLRQENVIGCGTAFVLKPNAAKTQWTQTVLYSFCSASSCADGEYPVAGLVMDPSGSLYGSTPYGGRGDAAEGHGGTVFELTPNAARTAWTHKVLYSFCVQGGLLCTDGENPSDLIIDASGRLYGTTAAGGAQGGGIIGGTIFQLTPNAARTTWTHKLLYSFCRQGGATCTDGQNPEGGLIMDKAGNLYGTTAAGGLYGGGTIFELTPNATRTTWTFKVLYSFCAQVGCSPSPGLVMDKAGNLYGTTSGGNVPGETAGIVFELTPDAARTAWTLKVLYSFCPRGGTCTDGRLPNGGLFMDASGNLYGTTATGGAHDEGTVFELKRS
jgi:uncharacterized repeat protein (TIGR03803 family)